MRRQMATFMITLMTLLASWQAVADKSTIAEVNGLIDGFHQAAADSHFDDYFSRFSHDAYFLGTDASERWSVTEFKEYARAPFAQGRGWRYDVLERQVETSGENNVYWFDEVLMNASLGRCRGTGVVIKEAGVWKIAHYSLTLLIPNDIADEVGQASMRADSLTQAR